MKGKIVRYGIDDRDHLVNFLNNFYGKNAAGVVRDHEMTPQTLGKNLSCFLYEREGKNFLCLFDGDDGSGGTPSDCKMIWGKFQNLFNQHNISDYLCFKIQHAKLAEQKQFYPFKTDVYPLALMTNNPQRIFSLADSLPKVKQDIDVLFVGGKVHDHNKPYCWPKHRNTNQHWPTNRVIGYNKLLEIKSRRTDLNIVTVDGLLPADQYYDLVNRSKICLDFPGIGVSSRKFYEFLVLGKCIVALRQNNCCWPLEENLHYVSLGNDFEYSTLEKTIDNTLRSENNRRYIENNAANLRSKMTFEAVTSYVENTIDQFVDRYFDGTLEQLRIEY